MKVSIKTTPKEKKTVTEYAKSKGIPLNEAFKMGLFKKTEDEYDIEVGEKAYVRYLNNPKTYSLKEIEDKLS